MRTFIILAALALLLASLTGCATPTTPEGIAAQERRRATAAKVGGFIIRTGVNAAVHSLTERQTEGYSK